jgi:hypothetical protein
MWGKDLALRYSVFKERFVTACAGTIMREFEIGRKVRCHNGAVEKVAVQLVGDRRRMACRIVLVPLLYYENQNHTRFESYVQRTQRKAYRRARKRALSRLRKGVGLLWTLPRSRGDVHQR